MASSDNVILSFSAFDLESGTGCPYDYLEVRSAPTCFGGEGMGVVSVCACLLSLGDVSACNACVCAFFLS